MPDLEPDVIAMVFRCGGCRQKHTYGVDYLKTEGDFPTHCPTCGDPWKGQEVRATPTP